MRGAKKAARAGFMRSLAEGSTLCVSCLGFFAIKD
jgi:hypothetical protein